MKIFRPTGGLDLITILWIVYGGAIFWMIPDWRLSVFSGLLACGAVASIGIWLNFRPSGYLFALSSLAGAALFVSMMLGVFAIDRPFSYRDLLVIGVLLYSVYAGLHWAKTGSNSMRPTPSTSSENAG